MKALHVHRLYPEDGLFLVFNGAFDAQAEWEKELTPLLQVLEEHAGEWMPDAVGIKRKRKYSRSSVWKELKEQRGERVVNFGLYRTKWPALDWSIGLFLKAVPPMLRVLLEVAPLAYFEEVKRCRDFVEMVRAWASHYPVTYAAAHSSDDAELAGFPRFGRDMRTSIRDGFDKIYAVFWLNVFGPTLVQAIGRERMLSTPAYLVEELPNGSVLLLTWPTVTDFASPQARLAQARAHAHLRPDLDFDTLLRALHERSAALTPVEPHFHPDLASLLSRVVDTVPSHARPRKIAELNAWTPPEPEEWRPAREALPPDVEDEGRALEHYGLLAEHLVALLHSHVPSVHTMSPESLTDADFYFWSEEFPTSRLPEVIEEHAVPAIGAYLGEVLVRHLGGQWLPRQKLEEAQVRVGERVWLPFLRARHYMRSRQALLDRSLTWLYREASRHRS